MAQLKFYIIIRMKSYKYKGMVTFSLIFIYFGVIVNKPYNFMYRCGLAEHDWSSACTTCDSAGKFSST